MNPHNSPVEISADQVKTFMDTLDNTCCRLQEKQILYSIKRLKELDIILCGLESELDTIIQKSTV